MIDGAQIRIIDLSSGRRWDVEAIQPRHHHRTEFGDSLDSLCQGAISESESRIQPETHKNIHYTGNPSEVSDEQD